jgi:hypothetical protein
MQNQSIHNQSVQKIKEKKTHQEQLHGVSQEACMKNQEEETLEIQLQLHDLIARSIIIIIILSSICNAR